MQRQQIALYFIWAIIHSYVQILPQQKARIGAYKKVHPRVHTLNPCHVFVLYRRPCSGLDSPQAVLDRLWHWPHWSLQPERLHEESGDFTGHSKTQGHRCTPGGRVGTHWHSILWNRHSNGAIPLDLVKYKIAHWFDINYNRRLNYALFEVRCVNQSPKLTRHVTIRWQSSLWHLSDWVMYSTDLQNKK